MEITKYYKILDKEVARQYEIAGKARAMGYDPSTDVEALPTRNLAERVEGLVGPKYIADEIKKAQNEGLPREGIVKRIIEWILRGTYLKELSREQRIEQALRTSLAILTEGVVSAPLEGISRVTIEKNPDGSEYLAVYYAGPIRGAGGTAAALSVLLADYIRRREGISDYRPTETEIERYKEEIKIYHRRVVRLQYLPSDEEIELIMRNVPVCIDGDPTEEEEVDIHKGLERIKTDRIRGGMCLVIGEGIAQKHKKVLKFAEAIGLEGWEWLKYMEREEHEKTELEREIIENRKFLEDVVAGRPIFAYPSRPGGFRLRYGRSNMCGIASKAIHPATMIILEEFPVVGTQLRIERPGKGMIAVPCAEIEGPVVKTKDGSVVRIETADEARAIQKDVEEVLFLGDILISYGDFLNSNETLPPSGYVEEWWEQEYKAAAGKPWEGKIDGKQAVQVSQEFSIPLHPKYTLPWDDIDSKELEILREWIFKSGEFSYEENKLSLSVMNEKGKRALEKLLVPHKVGEKIEIRDYAIPLLTSLGLLSGEKIVWKDLPKPVGSRGGTLGVIQSLSPVQIRRKVGCYVGARMGRPEKAKERKMEPAPHLLFPIGEAGGNTRNINVAAKNPFIRVEVARMRCPKCKTLTFFPKCPKCGERTELEYKCSCGATGKERTCKRCKKEMRAYELREVPIKTLFEAATARIELRAPMIKGVKGMTSAFKLPEPLEKGILRANNSVFVFKDGTIRYDATDIPTTHFRPMDIGTDVETLRDLGYEKDIEGDPLKRADQILQILPQDVVVPQAAVKYLMNACNFVDDLLEQFYGIGRFYNVKAPQDLIGQLIVGLAPHTSAAILGRIIGFSKVRGIIAHPFWHSAKRRNCDGDEDSIMLLLDVLINFSYAYLPEKRGGKMDAPLVINTNLDPKEVDSEAHAMEVVSSYPLSFYEKTQELPAAKEVGVDIVEKHLDNNPFNIGLTMFSTWRDAPKTSRYVQLKEMPEKALLQLELAKKIRAVDLEDAAKRLVNSHLIRDTYGNLRAFSRQKFRCVKCNRKYRRIPLLGRCEKCGGRIILTVSKGTIEKYVSLTKRVVEEYIKESHYMQQRVKLLNMEISSIFENDKVKQFSLSDFA